MFVHVYASRRSGNITKYTAFHPFRYAVVLSIYVQFGANVLGVDAGALEKSILLPTHPSPSRVHRYITCHVFMITLELNICTNVMGVDAGALEKSILLPGHPNPSRERRSITFHVFLINCFSARCVCKRLGSRRGCPREIDLLPTHSNRVGSARRSLRQESQPS